MADASKDPDQSMEDILQSIKRIIADETEPSPTVAGSDVLELTELLAEDVAVTAPVPAPVAETPKTPQDDIDALFNTPITMPEPEPEPVVQIQPEPEPVIVTPPPVMVTPAPIAPAPVDVGEKLMSDATLAASVAALSSLSHSPSPMPHATSTVFRSGTTVEDLVVEAIKPMLKEWLDSHLPEMVRALVEKEIRRLSA